MFRRYRVTIGNPHFSDASSSYQVRKYSHSALAYTRQMMEENPNRSVRVTDVTTNKVIYLIEYGELLIDELTAVTEKEPVQRRSRSWFRTQLKEEKTKRIEPNKYVVEMYNRRAGKPETRSFEVAFNVQRYIEMSESYTGFMYIEVKYNGEIVYESNYDSTIGRILVHTNNLSSAA
jgi:hypothetical protein